MTVDSGAALGSNFLDVSGNEGGFVTDAYIMLTVAAPGPSSLTNGGFESGLAAWYGRGHTVAVGGPCYQSSECAQLGVGATNGNSTLAQTFTIPHGNNRVSLWYEPECSDAVTRNYAYATLTDDTTATPKTLLPHTCMISAKWVNVTAAVTAGHTYTLTMGTHDEYQAGKYNWTLYDAVTLSAGGPVNGSFESGIAAWAPAGDASISLSRCRTGARCLLLGSSLPSNGVSSAAQTFVVPAGKSHVVFSYKMTCHDTVTRDWATVVLKDNTTARSTAVLPRKCATAGWVDVSAAVTAGHSYTLTLENRDNNHAGTASYTFYDDVMLT